MGPFRRVLVKFLIRWVRGALPMREHHKHAVILAWRQLRRAIIESAELAVERGWLTDVSSVWMLHHDELVEAPAANRSADWAQLRSHPTTRRDDHARFVTMSPPAVLLSTGEIPAMHDALAEGVLGGVPMSSGVVDGVVRVLRDRATETVMPGNILVAPFTDAAWTTLFVHARGVVLEACGMMSHGSEVAREYGIPAVVGVEGATTTFRTGQRVRVDGDTGIVSPVHADDRLP
jgi:phosphohistidine swiveling domain-containing protein